ncbi:MAG: cation transporter [Gemmatimonadales bacterium]
MARREPLGSGSCTRPGPPSQYPSSTARGCERIIREGLEEAPGIERVEVNFAARTVTTEHDPARTTVPAIEDRIRQAGFRCACEDERPGAAATPAREAAVGAEPAAGRPSRWYLLLAIGVVILAVAGYAGYALYPRFDLPAVQGAGLFLLAAGAGIASFFSPCAFPLLVALLGRETGAAPGGGRRGALARGLRFATALSIGAALFLLLAGIGIALGGGALFAKVTFTSRAGVLIRAVVGGVLILLGLVQLGVLPNPLHAVEAVAWPILRRQARLRQQHPALGFGLFGFGYLLAGFG